MPFIHVLAILVSASVALLGGTDGTSRTRATVNTDLMAMLQPGEGERIYTQTCMVCHQASGEGLQGAFPTLVGTEWVTGSETRLLRILLHGVTGDMEVEGEIYNGAMPTWGPMFNDAEIAAVATYVRTSWGNKAAPVKAATVARVRKQYEARTTPWTAAELRQTTKPPTW